MGQEKYRRSLNGRIARPIDSISELRPLFLVCNRCGNTINTIKDIDVRKLSGIDAAFSGICSTCKVISYAIKGKPNEMIRFIEIL